MSSQFDDLLGDFGDSSSGSAAIKTGGDSNGAEDSGLLVDFSVEAEVTNGQTNGVDHEMDSSSSANPLYDLTANDSQVESSNPLYEFSMDTNTSSSGNPLYDFTTEETSETEQQNSGQDNLFAVDSDSTTTPGTNSANPLYDFDATVTEDIGQKNEPEVDLLSGTNDAVTTGQSDQYADLLGDFNSGQQEISHPSESEQTGFSTQEYSGSDFNGGGGALLDLGPTDTTTEQTDTIVTTTYQDENPQLEAEETEQEPQSTLDEGVPEEPTGEVTAAETLPDLVVKEEGDEELKAEVTSEVQDQPEVEPEEAGFAAVGDSTEDVVEEREKELDREEAVSEEQEEKQYKAEADREEQEEERELEQQQAEAPDSTGNEGAYHADRREEDLEQYCLHREEETSEVSDGTGEAAAPEERDQTEMEEAQRQETDQTELEQAQRQELDETETEDVREYQEDQPTEDQNAVDQAAAPGEIDVPETEQEEPVQVEAAEPQKEEEILQDGHTVTKTTHTENRYSSGSGFENSQVGQDFASYSAKEDKVSKQNEPEMNRQTAAPQAAPRTQQPATLYDDDDEEEEGVYENEPERRDDVMREGDQKDDENLPVSGTTQNLLAKFKSNQVESSTPRAKREITPPNATQGGGEYVSEPRMQLEQYEGKPESGVFESQPVYQDDVVRSGSLQEEVVPEHGTTKNLTARFKQLESEKNVVTPSGKREITPDRSTRVEYVSEPRGFVEHYEGKAESGVFESEPAMNPDVVRHGEGQVEELPERGTTKNLADRFKQISIDSAAPVSSRGKREITPDTSGRVEYVSEPRGGIEVYEGKTESGVFENQPQSEADVVRAETTVEEFVPERGYTKNVAARFKELENNAKSPPMSPGRQKEFTPPRDEVSSQHSGVYESTPQVTAAVVTSSELPEEILPEQGTAKNIAQRFRQLEAESKSPPSAKPRKEFTPPPRDSGVYENQPDRFQADYNRPAESGILESQPVARDDNVTRESETPKFTEELPERGMARNLVSRWKQMESESTKSPSPGGRQKEFTPPREEPRIAQQSKSPRTPKSPSANASMDNGSVHPSELPGQYQPQNEPHVIESTPEEQRSDVIRSGETDVSAGLPKKNTAKKMLARFQNIQAEADKGAPRPESRKESESENISDTTTTTSPSSTTSTGEVDAAMQSARLKFEDPDKVGRSKSMKAAIQVEKCGACDKTVYAMERLEMNKRVYHRACFRCSQCKSVLTPKTFAINNDVIFCTTHYKQLFTRKGNYDEGFGRTQHKTRWNSNPNIAEAVNKEGDSDSRNQTEVKS